MGRYVFVCNFASLVLVGWCIGDLNFHDHCTNACSQVAAEAVFDKLKGTKTMYVYGHQIDYRRHLILGCVVCNVEFLFSSSNQSCVM